MNAQARIVGVAVTLVAIGAGLTGCGTSSGGSSGTQQKLSVTLTDAGCSPSHLSAKPGSIAFTVTNGGTGKVSELELKNQQGIILGEQENVVAGISGGFSLNLEPGRYILSCPNGSTEDNGSLLVKGEPVAATGGAYAAVLSEATRGYQTYVIGETGKRPLPPVDAAGLRLLRPADGGRPRTAGLGGLRARRAVVNGGSRGEQVSGARYESA